MILSKHDLSHPSRLDDITDFLSIKFNIPEGRNLLILLNDFESNNNRQAIQRWLKGAIWRQLQENPHVDLDLISNELHETVEDAGAVSEYF